MQTSQLFVCETRRVKFSGGCLVFRQSIAPCYILAHIIRPTHHSRMDDTWTEVNHVWTWNAWILLETFKIWWKSEHRHLLREVDTHGHTVNSANGLSECRHAERHANMHARVHTNAPAYVHTCSMFTTSHRYKKHTENNGQANYNLWCIHSDNCSRNIAFMFCGQTDKSLRYGGFLCISQLQAPIYLVVTNL